MKNQNKILAFCVPKPDGDFQFGSFTIRHMLHNEYLELYDKVVHRQPLYLFNSSFEIRDYHPTSTITKHKDDFTDITVCLSFFRPYISMPELENYYHYIKDYNVRDENRGRFEIGDITIPLHCLCTKPFNSKAGNLLYGKT